MSPFNEYDQYDGIGLARLVKDGEISSIELCEEAIRRAEILNPKLNAITTKLYDFAKDTANSLQADGPFCGVPFLIKDAHHALKGYPMSSGSELLRSYVPQYNAEIVNRFIKTGVVILGKTNTSEFKLSFVAEPKAFGPTRNPWNPDYTSGGSSGGSAAAVAAHIVPIASGTDEAGSIRVPASYCGLFGLKPSRGRNPVGPNFDDEWDGISHSHVITRSVRDSAAMLDAVCGVEPGAPYTIFDPERPFLEEVDHEPRHLRIGFYWRPVFGKNIHPECIDAVEQTCNLLVSLGHEVEEFVPEFTEEEVALNLGVILLGNTAALVDKLIQDHGSSIVKRDLELPDYAFYSIGKSLKALVYVKARRRCMDFGLIMDKIFHTYDLILTPTLGEPPILVGSTQHSKSEELSFQLISSFAGSLILSNPKAFYTILEGVAQNIMKAQLPFTPIANATGLPAMSVPLHWTNDGLPCGVQFIGRYGDEAKLFRLAGQLEKAKPWFDKQPPIVHKWLYNQNTVVSPVTDYSTPK